MRKTYQNRFSDDVGPTGSLSASLCELRQSGGHRFNMKAEEGVASRALMVHPRLRIVPVVLTKLQEFDAVLIVLNNVLFEPSDNEFSLLYLRSYVAFYLDILVELEWLSESKLLLYVEKIVHGIIIDFEI